MEKDRKIEVEVINERVINLDTIGMRFKIALIEKEKNDECWFRVPHAEFGRFTSDIPSIPSKVMQKGGIAVKVINGTADETGFYTTDREAKFPYQENSSIEVYVEARDGVNKIQETVQVNVEKTLTSIKESRLKVRKAYESINSNLHSNNIREALETVKKLKDDLMNLKTYLDFSKDIVFKAAQKNPKDTVFYLADTDFPHREDVIKMIAAKIPEIIIENYQKLTDFPHKEDILKMIAAKNPKIIIENYWKLVEFGCKLEQPANRPRGLGVINEFCEELSKPKHFTCHPLGRELLRIVAENDIRLALQYFDRYRAEDALSILKEVAKKKGYGGRFILHNLFSG